MEEIEGGTSSLHSLFTDDDDGKLLEDERKGHSCLDGVEKELSKLRNLEEDEGDMGSSMISGFAEFLQVWCP